MCFLSTFAFAQKATFTGKFKEIDVEKAGAFISNASDMSHSSIPMEIKPWPQYIMPDNFDSDLCKAYDIQGIPRFMMFDKNGKIIAIDAPRPSEENIIEWIEKNLK